MNWAFPKQKFQDWVTQQWVIFFGRKIEPIQFAWLMGPFGNINGIGEKFIHQLAEKENLIIIRNTESKGLLSSIKLLNLSEDELNNLSEKVIDFYEHTTDYSLNLTTKWNTKFSFFGVLVKKLFSERINQLNIPLKSTPFSDEITNEIIELVSPLNNEIYYKIWLRKHLRTQKIIYSGVYSTCKIPSGKTCIKAVFPLPKGNATVIMKPSVGKNNELILDSSGKNFGDAGFYFLLNDTKGNFWAKYISSFEDKLIVKQNNNILHAQQTLVLWKQNVASFNYSITKK